VPGVDGVTWSSMRPAWRIGWQICAAGFKVEGTGHSAPRRVYIPKADGRHHGARGQSCPTGTNRRDRLVTVEFQLRFEFSELASRSEPVGKASEVHLTYFVEIGHHRAAGQVTGNSMVLVVARRHLLKPDNSSDGGSVGCGGEHYPAAASVSLFEAALPWRVLHPYHMQRFDATHSK
jgi:hypothetical protein